MAKSESFAGPEGLVAGEQKPPVRATSTRPRLSRVPEDSGFRKQNRLVREHARAGRKDQTEKKVMSVTRRFLLLLGVVLCCAAVAMAQNLCVQDEYQLVNKQKLNCTANDVRIAKVQNVRDPITGAAITTCQAGQTFNFLADFQIVTTSSQSRENIGLYIATTSQTQALTGACVDHIISPAHTCAANAALSCGSDNFHNTDPAPDNCGDGASSDFSATFGAGAQKVTLEIDNFLCQAPAGTNQVQLPNCTSWQIPGGTIQCVSTSADTYPLNGP
jgi:hypothetical protein